MGPYLRKKYNRKQKFLIVDLNFISSFAIPIGSVDDDFIFHADTVSDELQHLGLY